MNLDNEAWLQNLADRHAGTVSQPVREAWDILFNQIYVQVPKTLGVLPNYRPVMNKPNRRTVIDYSMLLYYKLGKTVTSIQIVTETLCGWISLL